jgi:hypothetical protein
VGLEHQRGGDARGEAHDRAHREIDAGKQDDERLTEGHQGQDTGLAVR